MKPDKKEFLSMLEKAMREAPSILETFPHVKTAGDISGALQEGRLHRPLKELYPGFFVNDYKEAYDKMIRHYKRSFTSFDSYGLTGNFYKRRNPRGGHERNPSPPVQFRPC